ncbi:MAG: hypothetical protein JW953_05520 [Anaerolineae bacterium]|nr:hypothetical protein [Anaerolineae bacterium]
MTFGSGLTLWLGLAQTAPSSPTPRPTRRSLALTTATPAVIPFPTASATATLAPSPTATSTPLPPDTATPTPLPSSPTPLPPTATPSPSPLPPTAISVPTTTPVPSFAFTISEVEKFPTGQLNFDVYIAVTDANNQPLSGYRVLGAHSGGMQLESAASAGAWTENSGAMHYKAGNIKYQALNSSGGAWTLQLLNEAGQPAAPPLELSFDSAAPSWYFVLYRQVE